MDTSVKLPSSSYDELAKIIMGYGNFSKEGSLSDIAKIVGVGTTVVSGNNGFLLGVGIVEGGNKKKITSLGNRLAKAIEHSQEEETGRLWREVAEENEFLKSLVASVRIRRGMDDGALRSHVAFSAGQSKTQAVRTGSGTVIEILKKAGLLREEDGKLVADSQPPTLPSKAVDEASSNIQMTRTDTVISEPVSANVSGVHLSIQVRVNCTPDELVGLDSKLKNLMRGLSSAELDSDDNGDED